MLAVMVTGVRRPGKSTLAQYLLLRLSAYAVNLTKRLIKSPKLYWGDTRVAKLDDFIRPIIEFVECGSQRVHYARRPFRRESDFGVTSIKYAFAKLLAKVGESS